MPNQSILVVDDVEMNRVMLSQIFASDYEVFEACDGIEALEILGRQQALPVAILLDLVMPRLDGFGLLEKLKASEHYRNIPVILITSEESAEVEARVISMGGADLIRKPFNAIVVHTRVENAIQLYMHRNNLEQLVEKQTARIRQQLYEMDLLNESIVDTLSNAAEFRDMETGQHIKQIKNFTRIMLETYRDRQATRSLSDEEIKVISTASALHDIGKIAISDLILQKPGKLTPEEFEIMKTHTIRGCEIIDSIEYAKTNEYFRYAYDICRSHHERVDGRGYPDGLEGEEIPFAAQVVSLADVYDALINVRVYKPPFSHERACEMITGGECGAFSDRMLELFDAAAPRMHAFVMENAAEVAAEAKSKHDDAEAKLRRGIPRRALVRLPCKALRSRFAAGCDARRHARRRARTHADAGSATGQKGIPGFDTGMLPENRVVQVKNLW